MDVIIRSREISNPRALRNREARWEKSVTDALTENKGIGCRSIGGLVKSRED
jgi:hypothetical protein